VFSNRDESKSAAERSFLRRLEAFLAVAATVAGAAAGLRRCQATTVHYLRVPGLRIIALEAGNRRVFVDSIFFSSIKRRGILNKE
jgi:hypothetical protein